MSGSTAAACSSAVTAVTPATTWRRLHLAGLELDVGVGPVAAWADDVGRHTPQLALHRLVHRPLGLRTC